MVLLISRCNITDMFSVLSYQITLVCLSALKNRAWVYTLCIVWLYKCDLVNLQCVCVY